MRAPSPGSDEWRALVEEDVVDPEQRIVAHHHKHSKVDASADLGSETHQVFGTWAGRLLTDDGLALEFGALQGFAEEARQRW